ncbi:MULTISPECIES: hypothetical protein [Paenibacillus]|uniref:hypothetical protein n=1 Tax=Paenibacillus TaxID=44249 RepID=UPI0022B90640|nr:hypothetical protein [Paenibacillus caseinilyticus]MCZ8518188.1 hypothetical protein [Paenibacillus caseinilyticus]
MPSEYDAALCFVRRMEENGRPLHVVLEADLRRIFPGASLDMDPKAEEGLEIVVARINGLGPWESENELLDRMEQQLPEPWWNWLSGYRLQVTPKEDAGPCRLTKKREAYAHHG